jgi:hypothetical protein
MTHSELIAKAREHATVFERGVSYDARVSDFADVSVRDAVIVHFHSDTREDHIKIYLDRDSGDFITAEYCPPAARDS